MRFVIFFLLLCTLTACDQQSASTGSSSHPSSTSGYYDDTHLLGRPARWVCTHVDLGDSGYRAYAGPYYYTDEEDDDPDYYEIDVEYPLERSSSVVFSREFSIDSIPANQLNTSAEQIVSFDAEARVVTFNVAGETVQYTLPEEPPTR